MFLLLLKIFLPSLIMRSNRISEHRTGSPHQTPGRRILSHLQVKRSDDPRGIQSPADKRILSSSARKNRRTPDLQTPLSDPIWRLYHRAGSLFLTQIRTSARRGGVFFRRRSPVFHPAILVRRRCHKLFSLPQQQSE